MVLLFLQLAVSAAAPAQIDAMRFEMLVTNEIVGRPLARPVVFRQTSVQAGHRVRTDRTGLANRTIGVPVIPSTERFNVYNGKTLEMVTVDTVKREYYIVRMDSLGVTTSGMMKMFMDAKMSVSIDSAEATDLGPGPKIHDHPTRHWRMKQQMTIATEMMGESKKVSIDIDVDIHYAADSALPPNSMVSVAPGMMNPLEALLSKEDAARSDGAMAKLPNAFALKSVSRARYNGLGVESGFRLTVEVIGIEKIRVDSRYFELPVGYKQIPVPTLAHM